MAPDQLVDAVGVTRRFGEFTANDGIDVRVEAGEVVGLVGANGAGKSTFMRLLLGLLRPTEGTIRLFGLTPSRSVRRRIGYLPQGLGLYDDLTVAENLEFVARAYASTAAPPEDAELRAQRDTLVRDLPLGLRRRLAFTAALGHHPSLLILDEPTSGVDPLARSRLWDTIGDVAERGAGVLVSTHYMEEVEHCDRIVVLAAGRVIASGTTSAIIGGRLALRITTQHWESAFGVLDQAGIAASLHGRSLRLVDVDEQRVRVLLRAARVEADLDRAPATFEEAFVALVASAEPRKRGR